jgi:inorganic pyrophosphatase
MGLMRIHEGENAPEEVNVIIEIPMKGDPVKYEVDKDTGALFVDRFLSTAMYYPANYGYVPNTLSEDGDPVDVLVITPVPLISGSAIPTRLIGMLKMTDESGVDAKLIGVPADHVSRSYRHIKSHDQLPHNTISTIEHFFKHYKDLDEGKWVELDGWDSAEAAKAEVVASIKRYQATKDA